MLSFVVIQQGEPTVVEVIGVTDESISEVHNFLFINFPNARSVTHVEGNIHEVREVLQEIRTRPRRE